MTKEVLLTISGLHYDMIPGVEQPEDEPIEVLTAATYYYKNGKHYILYDEVIEGLPGVIKNTIKISEEGQLDIKKSGLSNTHMVFEKKKINVTEYETPYGELLIGVYTNDMQVEVDEQRIDVAVSYELDINGEKVADCDIAMKIRANGS